MDWKKLKPIELSKIKAVDFPDEQYYPIETNKKQLVLHHTVSGPSVRGDIQTWLNDSARVATHFIIDRDGTPYQLFSSKYWSHHLGVTKDILSKYDFTDVQTRNVELNQNSIGFEIDNWGYLILGDGTSKQFGKNSDGTPKMINTIKGKYYAAYGNIVDVDIEEYPNLFRGYKYYEKYTDAQIQTIGELLLYFNKKFGIPLDYNEDMWNVSKDALSGKSGIWSHCSFRPDKSDLHPQKEVIDMLKTLKLLI